METFTESLSFDGQIVPYSQAQLTLPEQVSSKEVSTEPQSIEVRARNLAELLRNDKQAAQLAIQELVSSAKDAKAEMLASLTATPVHPYEKLKLQYLGSDFVCPTIHDWIIPMDFCPKAALTDIQDIAQSFHELQMSHFAKMSAEAMDTSFVGITSQNLNNAFAVISATDSGEQLVVDKKKVADQLKFIETIKSIPTDYIIENPLEVAKKMLAEYTRLNKN